MPLLQFELHPMPSDEARLFTPRGSGNDHGLDERDGYGNCWGDGWGNGSGSGSEVCSYGDSRGEGDGNGLRKGDGYGSSRGCGSIWGDGIG